MDAQTPAIPVAQPKKKAGWFLELVFLLLAVAIDVFTVITGFNKGLETALYVCLALCVVYFIIVMCSGRLRRNSYIKWLAWIGLIDAAYWMYDMFSAAG